MANGIVKWFNSQKGYGFVTPDIGGREVFVHHSSIQMNGYKELKENQKVEFSAEETDKGLRATSVTPL